MRTSERLLAGALCAVFIVLFQACTGLDLGGHSAETLRTPEGLVQWQQREESLEKTMREALKRYQRDGSLQQLKSYEREVRAYLDNGFALYRAYLSSSLTLPDGLIPSLEHRTDLLMDVADEYIKHASVANGERIASNVIHDYSDLPVMAPAQRRAEAVLLRYRYRQDY